MTTWYCTREDVKGSLDVLETARNNRAVDRAIDAGARNVEGLLHRTFRPVLATRYFPWPDEGRIGTPWRLWLDGESQLIEATTVTSGGVAIAAGDYFLEPVNSGPPYTHLEIDLDSSAAFGGGSTHQRDVAITGLWGYRNDEATATTLAAGVTSSATTAVVANGADVGVGDVLRVGTERMVVTGRAMADTGEDLAADLASSAADTLVSVTSGGTWAADEVIMVGAERMLVVEVAGDSLVVERAWDGSVLAAHTNGDGVYAARSLTVERGALGTTAAAHDAADTVYRHVVPGLVRDLNVAEAIVQLAQEGAGYGRTVGAGEGTREARGVGLADKRRAAVDAYGRQARTRAV